jgi:transcriptional regulator with XRE-family HTH domain
MAQVRLGEILGIDQSHVSNIERGARSVTIQQLTKLSKAFGVSIDQLLAAREGKALEVPRSLRSGRLLRRLRRIEELPVAQQRAVLKILDGLLDQRARGNGRRS